LFMAAPDSLHYCLMIIVRNKITGFILGKNFLAMCLYPFLLVNRGVDIGSMPHSLNHEKIHARQQLEMLVIFFYLWYAVEYLLKLLSCRSFRKAYLALSHEQEAYAHQQDPGYLSVRKPYSWWKYL